MFCIKCGKEIRDDAMFCQFCGNPISVQNNDPTVYRQSYSNTYNSRSLLYLLRDVPMHYVVIVLLLISFIGVFTPWLTYKASILGYTVKENSSFWELFESSDDEEEDEDDEEDDDFDDYWNESGSKARRAKLFAYFMKYFGLAGYIVILLAIILKNYQLQLSIAASSFFFIALISGYICCSTTKDLIKDYMGEYRGLVNLDFYPSIGLYISLLSSVLAVLCCLIDVRKRKMFINQ